MPLKQHSSGRAPGHSRHHAAENNSHECTVKLGDFTTDWRVIPISAVAIGIGALSAYIALGLLRLIGIFTNFFFYQRWGTALVSPAGNKLGYWEILVPVVGALIVGFMARYGSERIRGHGIPEALEAILISGSKVEPRVAILKPVSSAISIGSGGPFGAEGPIIMTGGAFGSMIAQFLHLTSAERKTLLVAGAAGGMTATFASPVAGVLLGVELMLFEWKPRSLIPVTLASAAAAAVRRHILGLGPLFPVPAHSPWIGAESLLGCVLVGLLAGVLSVLVTHMVYAAEDGFGKLPIHWMWWPPIGGLVVGLGGLVFPQALGVGYDTIGSMLQGNVTTKTMLGILVVKSIIWSVSLGSGTSGGVLAPLLLMGGALGGLEAGFLPNQGAGFWPLISMSATLGATMGIPLTGVVFTLELTHDMNALLPLLVAGIVSQGVTVLALKRSILTEKVARRGYHLSREYAVDPLEILFVREVMRTNIVALPAEISVRDLDQKFRALPHRRGQQLYPVVDRENYLVGIITRNEVRKLVQTERQNRPDQRLAELVESNPVVVHPDEPLRMVVNRMADTGLTRFPVVEGNGRHKLVGMISIRDLLQARVRSLEEERRRERVLRIRLPFENPSEPQDEADRVSAPESSDSP